MLCAGAKIWLLKLYIRYWINLFLNMSLSETIKTYLGRTISYSLIFLMPETALERRKGLQLNARANN